MSHHFMSHHHKSHHHKSHHHTMPPHATHATETPAGSLAARRRRRSSGSAWRPSSRMWRCLPVWRRQHRYGPVGLVYSVFARVATCAARRLCREGGRYGEWVRAPCLMSIGWRHWQWQPEWAVGHCMALLLHPCSGGHQLLLLHAQTLHPPHRSGRAQSSFLGLKHKWAAPAGAAVMAE